MDIYLVRHCQTTLNALGIHQDEDSTLSKKGFVQANIVGDYFMRNCLMPELILTSPRKRALQTAEILSEILNIPILKSELATNIKRPSEIIGRRIDEIDVINVFREIEANYHIDTWKYSDEENFKEVMQRAKKLINYIDKLHLKRLLIISHGSFINALTVFLKNGYSVSPSLLLKEFKENEIKNCSVTHIKHLKKSNVLVHYNDNEYLLSYLSELSQEARNRPNEVW